MTDVPPSGSGRTGDDPGADAQPSAFPSAAGYPPPFVADQTTSDDELAAALAAQTAMYTGPITIPLLNSDPVFDPDPAQRQHEVPPPAPDEPALESSAGVPDAAAALPSLPPVPPPPAPAEYIAPDVIAADPEPPTIETLLAPPPAPAEPAPAEPAPAEVAPAVFAAAEPAPAEPVPASVSEDDELSRTVEQEASAGSTLDAILLLENELRRRQGLPPVPHDAEPPAEAGAAIDGVAEIGEPDGAFGPVVPDGPPQVPEPIPFSPPADEPDASSPFADDVGPIVPVPLAPPPEPPPGWTPAPDPEREGSIPSVLDPLTYADGDAAGELQPPDPTEPEPQPWLGAPPPAFAPPPLVEPPTPEAGPLDTGSLTPTPVSELPPPLLPPPVTSVEGPDGPVDVRLLPPPTDATPVEVPVAGFQVAPPPDDSAVPLAPPAFDALLLGEPAADPELDGIDPSDRADLAAPIPEDGAGFDSVAPAPVASTAAVIAVGVPEAEPGIARDPDALVVETVAAEPTPLDQRAGHATRLFWLWFAANSSMVIVAVGATLFGFGMSLRQVLVAIVAGVALSALPLGLGTLAGKWSGQPTMIVSRATFGLSGNILPAMLAVIGRVLWGGVLLWLLAVATSSLLAGARLDGGLDASFWAAVALAVGVIVAGLVAVFGYGLLVRVQRVLGILAVVLVTATIVLTAGHVDFAAALKIDDGPWVLAIGGIVVVFSVVGLAWAQSSSDLARYQRAGGSGAANMLWGSFGVIIPTLLVLSWGAVLAASDPVIAEGLASDPLTTLLELVPPWFALPLLAASAFGLVAGAIATMYSGGLALVATGLRAPRSVLTAIAAVLVGALGAWLIALGADGRDVVSDVATTVAVPVAAWVGIFASEMMIRLRRFHAPSLLTPGGVYPAVRWANLIGLVVISGIGFGFTSAQLAGLDWQGYLLGVLGVANDDPLARVDLGVLIALGLGLLLPLATSIPAIRRQEQPLAPAGAAAPPPAGALVD